HLAGAVERRLGIGNAGILALLGGEGLLEIAGRLGLRIECWILEQRAREWLEARLARDLRLGAALGFEGEVEILQALLGIGRLEGLPQLRRQLSLLLDA